MSLCQPLQLGHRKEVIGFTVDHGIWPKYDWSKLTTLVLFQKTIDLKLVCHAHSKNVRVVLVADYPVKNLTNQHQRSDYVKSNVAKAKKYYLDGINIDIEQPILKNSAESKGLIALVKEMTDSFHSQIPGSQVSIDVAWSPKCIDKRCYDYASIAKVSDFMVVMSYDERSQVYGSCVASANSPFNQTFTGVQQYLDLGITADKLVLGQPWYGYDYICLNVTADNICQIKKVPFRGAPCSDAAGLQHGYSKIQMLLSHNATTDRIWNGTLRAPFFNYKSAKDHKIHQIWYDDPESLKLKYETAKHTFKMRGLAFWTVDSLDYGNSPSAKNQTKEMWNAITV
ncbi:uncharacterized protein TRIADDRAFT_56839 [Trichoplax adhaerens]|uniref:Di-N-acetylchitobiase n=1 Tax=Trichoplax adhaerens TaxID=10228 RepID=B3RWQ4_TRIAD|nr:hypothetical protein TRIADDRAFT_56839 [Trichoplax adhaerens]EDV24737.1 hypothetical protein TRIADDRAFT_56839 [Trichoplax adhaerens]|eukprot:XP_002112627.1 hypothetical protein TRIADDRAFT_56839 [Trichoplax adhaerens]